MVWSFSSTTSAWARLGSMLLRLGPLMASQVTTAIASTSSAASPAHWR